MGDGHTSGESKILLKTMRMNMKMSIFLAHTIDSKVKFPWCSLQRNVNRFLGVGFVAVE